MFGRLAWASLVVGGGALLAGTTADAAIINFDGIGNVAQFTVSDAEAEGFNPTFTVVPVIPGGNDNFNISSGNLGSNDGGTGQLDSNVDLDGSGPGTETANERFTVSFAKDAVLETLSAGIFGSDQLTISGLDLGTVVIDSDDLVGGVYTFAPGASVAANTDLVFEATGGAFRISEITVIPEPASVALLGLGGLMMLRRRTA